MTDCECTRANIQRWWDDCQAEFPADEEFFSPLRARSMKMRDCVRSWYGYNEGMLAYEEFWWFLYNNTNPVGGGRRSRKPDADFFAEVPISYENILRVSSYDLYICGDGRIRYIPDERIERDIESRCAQRHAASNAAFEKALKHYGYEFDEEIGFWTNPETGHVAADYWGGCA